MRNRNTYRNNTLIHRYGITLEQKLRMLQDQYFKCAICSKIIDESAHIDHNHQTKRIRALLCRACNHLIGNAEENEKILLKAIKYLKFYKGDEI